MYMIHITVSTQLIQLRFTVVPELSGKVEYERERLFNTVLKCGALQVKLPAFRLRLQNAGLLMDNLGKIGRSLTDNLDEN